MPYHYFTIQFGTGLVAFEKAGDVRPLDQAR
jgi:hypothetical protein